MLLLYISWSYLLETLHAHQKVASIALADSKALRTFSTYPVWNREKNSENCGPLHDIFDLEVGQRSRSRLRHGTSWKGLPQGSCKININALSLILQKIWARLMFLWRTDGHTDKWVLMSPAFKKVGDKNTCRQHGTYKMTFSPQNQNTCIYVGGSKSSETNLIPENGFILSDLIMVLLLEASLPDRINTSLWLADYVITY